MNVVLSGSGIQYPLHAGALEALVEEGYTIDKILGVSGGAIVGGAVASGYKPGNDLNDLILDTLPGPNNLLDPHWLPMWGWGIYQGDLILNAFQRHMVSSFEDTSIPFHAVTVNVDADEMYTVFGPGADTTVPKAVRASMTFPFVFEPVEIQGDRHVDGGVAANFPVDFYGDDTVGFHVRSNLGRVNAPDGWGGLLEFGSYLMSTMIHAINREDIADASDATIVPLHSETGVLDLDITRDQAKQMIETGYQTTKEYLHGRHH